MKIDQEFVRDAPHDNDDRSIMQAIVAMGHSLDLTVVVEGIESEKQSSIAKSMQSDKAQGIFYYPPLEAEAIRSLLLENRKQPLSIA